MSIINKVRPGVFWTGLATLAFFAAGVGVAVLVRGTGATPGWLRGIAAWIGVALAITVVHAGVHRAMNKCSVKQIRRHLLAGRYRRAAVELQVYVHELEKTIGQYDPLTLRWTFTLAHVLLHIGHTMRALALLTFVVDAQLRTLGPSPGYAPVGPAGGAHGTGRPLGRTGRDLVA